jgi:hypothetical protein
METSERLGPPQRTHVIEPFAGSAGYSCFWQPKKVTLIERDPLVVGIWKFLQRSSPTELMRLPSNISHVDELAVTLRDRPQGSDFASQMGHIGSGSTCSRLVPVVNDPKRTSARYLCCAAQHRAPR